jgi:hypothetical protein
VEASAKSKKRTSQKCQWSARLSTLNSVLIHMLAFFDDFQFRRGGARNALRTLDNLQGLRCLESLAKDRFPGGDFSNGIGMDHVAAVR